MKLAFSNLAWPATDDGTALPELRASGFDALEVAPTRLWPDPLERSAEDVAAARAVVEAAGLRIVALQSLLFQRPDLQLFGRLGAAAADRGVSFCIEANPVDYKCDYLTDAVASTAFVRAVDSAGVRLHLDTACMAMAGDDAGERIRAGADVLAHVHASAPQLGAVGPGGLVDHEVVAAALREIDYTGHVSVEMLAQTDDVLGSVRRTADYVRKTYA